MKKFNCGGSDLPEHFAQIIVVAQRFLDSPNHKLDLKSRKSLEKIVELASTALEPEKSTVQLEKVTPDLLKWFFRLVGFIDKLDLGENSDISGML